MLFLGYAEGHKEHCCFPNSSTEFATKFWNGLKSLNQSQNRHFPFSKGLLGLSADCSTGVSQAAHSSEKSGRLQ